MRKCKGQTRRGGLTHRVDLYELARISYAIGRQFNRQITAIDEAFRVERCAISRRQQTMSRHELPLSLCAINIIWPIEFSLNVKTIQRLIIRYLTFRDSFTLLLLNCLLIVRGILNITLLIKRNLSMIRL